MNEGQQRVKAHFGRQKPAEQAAILFRWLQHAEVMVPDAARKMGDLAHELSKLIEFLEENSLPENYDEDVMMARDRVVECRPYIRQTVFSLKELQIALGLAKEKIVTVRDGLRGE